MKLKQRVITIESQKILFLSTKLYSIDLMWVRNLKNIVNMRLKLFKLGKFFKSKK